MSIHPFAGCHPKVGEGVYIADSAVVIGDVTLMPDVSVWPTAVVRGDVERIWLGEACNVQDGAVLHVSHAGPFSPQGQPLLIGKGVTIGHRAVVHACTVGDFCLLGMGAVVLDGAVLEDHVMLGAGALVASGKTLAGGHLYVGMPARQARPLTERERAFLHYSADHYVALKNRYLRGGPL